MTKLIRGLANLKPEHQGCALTIGNFDGVHLGHQALLSQLEGAGKREHAATMVITFEPHPFEFFNPKAAIPRITRFREKFSAICAHHIDYVLVLKFNQQLANVTAQAFIQDVLKPLQPTSITLGADFHFGFKRLGTIECPFNTKII